jgi:hypothetical protein
VSSVERLSNHQPNGKRQGKSQICLVSFYPIISIFCYINRVNSPDCQGVPDRSRMIRSGILTRSTALSPAFEGGEGSAAQGQP